MTLDELTRLACDKIEQQGLRVLATICESARLRDIAVRGPRGSHWLVRCASEPDDSDHAMLATILAQGPFTRTALLYCQTNDKRPPGAEFGHLLGLDQCTIESLGEVLSTWMRQENDR